MIDAALELVDERGLGELTMGRLARRLDVGTMTLYGYVEGKQDLLERMVDRLFEDLEVPGQVEEWEGRVGGFLRAFRRRALRHPGLFGAFVTGGLRIPRALEHLDELLETMLEAGFSPERAVRAFFALFTYTLGFVVWEIPGAHAGPPGAYGELWAAALGMVGEEDLPVVREALPSLVEVASEAQFEFGLMALMTALPPGGQGCSGRTGESS